MEKSTIRRAFLISFICLFSMTSFAQVRKPCLLCSATGRMPCIKCAGKTFTSRDENGLAIFCSKCACDYCGTKWVGTNKCIRCSGKRFIEEESKKEESFFEGTLRAAGSGYVAFKGAEILEKFRANYQREKSKIKGFEYQKKQKAKQEAAEAAESLRREREQERKRKKQIERNKKQYSAKDIEKMSEGKITSDYRSWLGSFKFDYSKYTPSPKSSYIFDLKGKKQNMSKTIFLLADSKKTYLTYDTEVKINLNLNFKTALVTKKMKDSMNFYGKLAIYFKLEQTSKFFDKPPLIRSAIATLPDMNLLHYVGLISMNQFDRLEDMTKKHELLRSKKLSYTLPSFMGITGGFYSYKLSVYIGSRKENSSTLTLIKNTPIKVYYFEFISSKDFKKQIKEKYNWKIKYIYPDHSRQKQSLKWINVKEN